MRRRRKGRSKDQGSETEAPAGLHEAPPPPDAGVAVLVDGDNVPPELLGPVLEHLRSHGSVTDRRIYRNWRSTRDSQAWDAASKRFAFERMDRYKTTEGKNSSDIAVAVGAMDLYFGGYRRFCIVSGDTDFAPLVERLRRGGAKVTIVGHKPDPGLLEEISDEYLTWRSLVPRQGAREAGAPTARAATASRQGGRPAGRPAAKAAAKPAAKAADSGAGGRAVGRAGGRAEAKASPSQGAVRDEALLATLVDSYEVARTDGDVDQDGWVAVSRLGQIARTVDQDFGPKRFGLGARTPLYRLFERFPKRFEVRPIGKGRSKQYRVRLR